MQAIVNFFEAIGDGFTSLIDFLLGMVADLVFMIKSIGVTLANIPKYFAWLPDEMLAMLIAIITVVAIYKIMGREG